MEHKPIYLCYNVSYCGRCLEYIGDYLPDCFAAMAKAYDLSKDECDKLVDGNEVYVEHLDARIVIEEKTLNAFCIWPSKSI
jgi:hypothetical protein